MLTYVATEHWFRGVSRYASPDGHEWGVKAHRIVAQQLAPRLVEVLAEPVERSHEAAAVLGSGRPASRGREPRN